MGDGALDPRQCCALEFVNAFLRVTGLMMIVGVRWLRRDALFCEPRVDLARDEV